MFRKFTGAKPKALAAARHPDLFARFESFDLRCEHEVGVSCLHARVMGQLLGLAGEAPVNDGWWRKVQRRLVDNGCDPNLVDRWMQIGYAVGRGLLEPDPGIWTPDEGSRLQDWFELRTEGFVDLGGAASDQAEPTMPEVARCDFHLGAIRWSGTLLNVEGRAVRLLPDELEEGHSFLWMGCAGESALRLRFRTRPEGSPLLMLRVWVQKGRRPALPHTGHAGLTFTLDGRPQTAINDLTAPTAHTIKIPLGRNPLAAYVHTLELRLRADANTTLRIYEVVVE